MKLTNLKLARLRAGLSQWEVAKRANISESYLSRLENGRKTPSKEQLATLSKVLKVPQAQLVDEGLGFE